MKLKRLLATLVAPLLVAGLTPAQGAPSQGGFATDNVEYVDFLPFEVGTATGASVIGKYLYVTGWKTFSIYDVSDPVAPEKLSTTPFGFKFENEDVATNGKIMLFSESLPQSILHVWDVEDKTNPVEIATLPNAGDHTMSCILKCKWAYGSDGAIVDLRNPSKPKLAQGSWHQLTGLQGGAHDVREYKNGFILTEPLADAFQVVDVRKPLKPKVLARGTHPDPTGYLFHSGRWPNQGRDRFILQQGEQNAETRCNDHTGPFMVFDTKGMKKTKTARLIDTFRLGNGTYADGSPAVNGLGCSAHWFQEHSTFNNGGLVALGYYEHGTRFLDIQKNGKIKEVGWFLPHAGSTSASYWLKKRIVYSVDYTRGVDILKYTGKF
jgi:LVIVD repeat